MAGNKESWFRTGKGYGDLVHGHHYFAQWLYWSIFTLCIFLVFLYSGSLSPVPSPKSDASSPSSIDKARSASSPAHVPQDEIISIQTTSTSASPTIHLGPLPAAEDVSPPRGRSWSTPHEVEIHRREGESLGISIVGKFAWDLRDLLFCWKKWSVQTELSERRESFHTGLSWHSAGSDQC